MSDSSSLSPLPAEPQSGSSARFPRSSELPSQSPKFWAKEKDRYLRQLLISDIEVTTGRPLVVYFAQLDQQITHTDPDDITEILSGVQGRVADIMIQTPGDVIDATEKIISILQHVLDEYRVIVPSWAKSAGAVIACSSNKIFLGLNSELGPIDPQWQTPSGMAPCEIIANDPAFPQHVRELATLTVKRMRAMARSILSKGMLKDKDENELDEVIKKISSSDSYMSHGAVIDYDEAKQISLSVEYLAPESELWRRI